MPQGSAKRKILMLGPEPPPFGGVVSVMNEIMGSPLADRYEFEIFPTSGGSQPSDEGFTATYARKFRRFARFFLKVARGKYALIHLHTSQRLRGTMLYVLLARLAGTRVIVQIHHSHWNHVLVHGSRFTKLIVRMCLTCTSKILVMNESWLAAFADLGIRTNVTLVRNFLSPHSRPGAEEIRKACDELGLAQRNFVVLTVAAVAREKGAYDTLDAVPSLVKSDDTIRFLFVGGGLRPGDESRFRDAIVEKGLDKWVLVTGEVSRDRVPVFLALADLFLLPSHAESMPISVLEAMRDGLAIIATRVGSIPKMVQDGTSGLFIPVGSPEDIAQAVLRLRQEEAERLRLGAAGRHDFEEKFQASSALKELESIYGEE